MTMKIKLTYFYDEEVTKKEVIFEGALSAWKEEVGSDWVDFNLGDTFLLNDDRVRVYGKQISFGDSAKDNANHYFVAPTKLSTYKINHEKLK